MIRFNGMCTRHAPSFTITLVDWSPTKISGYGYVIKMLLIALMRQGRALVIMKNTSSVQLSKIRSQESMTTNPRPCLFRCA